LALDEHRAAFTPTLFYVSSVTRASDEEVQKQQELCQNANNAWKDIILTDRPSLEDVKDVRKTKNEAERKLLDMADSQKDRSKLLQVWFPGVHINVGGGSTLTMENKGNMEEMSNIAFAWMLDQIKGFVSFNEETLRKDELLRQVRLTKINNALNWYNERMEKRKKESWSKWLQRGSQWIASSVLHPLIPGEKPAYMGHRIYTWGLGDLPDNFGVVYIANGSRPRTPGRYALDKQGQKLGETFEHIHPVVGYRVERTDKGIKYRPIGLTGDKYERRKNNDGYYEYRFKYPGSSEYQVLPEWKLSEDEDAYERLVVKGSDALVYVAELNPDNGEDIKSAHSLSI
jgi:hypothetical protein